MTFTKPDNLEILRAYTKQFEGKSHDPADDEAINNHVQGILNFLDVYDSDRARGDLARDAERYGIPLNEYVGAIDEVMFHTNHNPIDAEFEIQRVLDTFRELAGEPVMDLYRAEEARQRKEDEELREAEERRNWKFKG